MKQVIAAIVLLAWAGCGKTASNGNLDDNSPSGAAAAAVGGAVSGSSSTGTQAFLLEPALRRSPGIFRSLFAEPSAWAIGNCPTWATSAGATCSAAGGFMTLTYTSCSFAGSSAVWNGQQLITSTGTVSCGVFPGTGLTGSLTRTFAGTILGGNATTRVSTSGVSVELDTSSNLPTYNSATGIGGGSKATFSVGVRTSLDILGIQVLGQNGGAAVFNHVITTHGTAPLTISETGSSTIVNGTVLTYHNLASATGSAQFNNVTFTPGCCNPTSGSIVTTFTGGGARFNGKSETMTFTGCNQASLSNVDGTTGTVNLTHCW